MAILSPIGSLRFSIIAIRSLPLPIFWPEAPLHLSLEDHQDGWKGQASLELAIGAI